jgi:hypothetical protein
MFVMIFGNNSIGLTEDASVVTMVKKSREELSFPSEIISFRNNQK